MRAVRRLLRSAGYAIDTFASAEEFLDLGNQARPDCLVLDVHLGGLSGFALQEQLAAAGRAPGDSLEAPPRRRSCGRLKAFVSSSEAVCGTFVEPCKEAVSA